MSKYCYIYVLRSVKDNQFYVGLTRDLPVRVLQHNNGLVTSTKKRIPFELVYWEGCINESDAAQREQYLKSAWGKRYIKSRLRRSPACETRALPYAGAPPRAPGSGGATSGATTCLGGLSGSFLVVVELMPGGGFIRRPWSMISLICEPSKVSYSSKAFAMVSSVSRLVTSVCLAS